MSASEDKGQAIGELKPCPFCGGSKQIVLRRSCERNSSYDPTDVAYPRVLCPCGVEVAGENWTGPETAIAAWNKRAE